MFIEDASNPIYVIIDCTILELYEGSINSSYFHDWAVVVPTKEIVDNVNEHVLLL